LNSLANSAGVARTNPRASKKTAPPPRAAQTTTGLNVLAKKLLAPVMGLWMITGGLVMIDPSPYELVFFILLPIAILAGVGLHRGTVPILSLLVVFIPFALIAAFQVTFMPIFQAIMYSTVTFYLWFTAFFVANYVADAPHRRLKVMINAYTGIAVFIVVIGTLAYLRLIPDFGQLLENSRVRATFKDPNVFAPFLMIPAMFALQRALMDTGRRSLVSALVYGILFIGVFVSFSRGAWGNLFLSSLILFVLCFLLEANVKDKARMTALALIGAAILVAAIIALLSIDSVRDLFLTRASLVQNYDSGSTGRFGRQAYAFELALANPWGIGPLEFRNLRINEEPHNTYVNVLHVYGWGGGLAYFALVWMTLKRGFSALVRPSPNRLLLIPVISVFVPLVLESAIIDTDHWRHYFVVVGMIWGIHAGYMRSEKAQNSRRTALL